MDNVCGQNLKNMEIEFRASCKKKRSELVARIKELQDPNATISEQSEREADIETTYDAEIVKLDAVRKVSSTRLPTAHVECCCC